jgi:hypothetical protein
MKRAFVLGLILCTGCATTSQIVPYGKDTYLVNAEDVWGTNSTGNLAVRALEQANIFCAKQNKIVQTINAEQRGNVWVGTSSNLIFTCSNK